MRISDWSSDVCSSDLRLHLLHLPELLLGPLLLGEIENEGAEHLAAVSVERHDRQFDGKLPAAAVQRLQLHPPVEGGRLAARQEAGQAGPMRLSMSRSEEHTSELQSLMRISYAVFCLKKKTK